MMDHYLMLYTGTLPSELIHICFNIFEARVSQQTPGMSVNSAISDIVTMRKISLKAREILWVKCPYLHTAFCLLSAFYASANTKLQFTDLIIVCGIVCTHLSELNIPNKTAHG